MPETKPKRPAFIDALSHAYHKRCKSALILTGDILDLFWSERADGFIPLEQTLYQELSDKFLVVRLDAATGISFYDDADAEEVARVCELGNATASRADRIDDVAAAVATCRHQPLPAIVLLRSIADAFTRVRRVAEGRPMPLAVIIQFAGSLFPAGDFDRLSEVDRQRLVTFLNWLGSPLFAQSSHLVLLVSDTRSEVNSRILSLPTAQVIEIELPSRGERAFFVERFLASDSGATFEAGSTAFVEDTAGLKLTNLQDLLESAARTKQPVSRRLVLQEVNHLLEAELGEVIRVARPGHGPDDIIGYQQTRDIFRSIFRRCEDPQTAVSAVLVSGPNGGGKTFQLEAYAAESGRLVIELTGLRGMYFGQTDRLFELLRLRIRTYGKILILVDEAHTAFGSVHDSNTHETEKRLAGNIIKMMGDRTLLGQVLWGLMTSRPDELDPDVKSRAPLQLPIFDLEGDERRAFVRDLFRRETIPLDDAVFETVFERTAHYSARDFSFLVREVRADGRPVAEVLDNWQASSSILLSRRLQSLIAAQHCSYPRLLPPWLARMGTEEIQAEVDRLKLSLLR